MSGVLGADEPAYGVDEGGLAWNPAQHLRLRFVASGLSIVSGGLRVDLGLNEIGYGTSSRQVRPVRPTISANGVSYTRPGLLEWYRNGPLGVEQGFTVSRARHDRGLGTLTLAIAILGNAGVRLTGKGRELMFVHRGEEPLRYAGLLASDARGRLLHSWLELRGRRLLLRVDTGGAVYPLRIDPLIQQGVKLAGSEAEGKGEIGASVALSTDGNTALIGGAQDDGGVGAAWVFVRSGPTWVQQGPKLTGSAMEEEGKGEFGASVALSADGNTAVIGGPGDDGGHGAAWVFIRSGSTWIERNKKLTGTNEQAVDDFGAAVALSGDGETALIGEPTHRAPYGGTAWIFRRSGPPLSGIFEQEEQLEASELSGEGGDFGATVALSPKGDTAFVGDPYENFKNGAVVVFTGAESTWNQREVLRGEGAIGEDQFGATGEIYFGASIAISEDGETLLVGGPGDDNAIGAVWVFERSGSTWKQQKLTGDGETGAGNFGASVALSSDGNTGLVGAPGDNFTGAAWLLKRSGATWRRDGEKLTGQGEVGAGHVGSAVALSGAGNIALLGGPTDNSQDGAVWTFASAPPSVATNVATGVGAEAATLNGAVDPNELASTAHFQYGTSASYGQLAAAESVGGGDTIAPFSSTIGGLMPATTYHFRIVAESSAGTSYGVDQTFTTAPPVPPVPPVPLSTVAPAISGTPIRGRALSVSPGSWTNAPSSFAYQWQTCDANGLNCGLLNGASGSTHTVTSADVGHTLRAIVTAGNAGGSTAASSNASALVGSQVESTMTWTFGWSRRYTVVESLVVHQLLPGGSVTLTCDGFGCPFVHASAASRRDCRGRRCKIKHTKLKPGEVDLTRLFKGHRLRVGAHIAVHILQNGWVGKSFLFTMRANHAPSFVIACLAPGSEVPGRGC